VELRRFVPITPLFNREIQIHIREEATLRA
jgi:hypothetical protein